MSANITQERAAQRFHHIERLERVLTTLDGDIVQCKEHLKDLRERREALIDRMRCSARNEGELPLFDLLDEAEG